LTTKLSQSPEKEERKVQGIVDTKEGQVLDKKEEKNSVYCPEIG